MANAAATRPARPEGWLGPAVALVGAITAARLALLSLNRTDLFVDEAQYWLWGQELALGYYSKPPLIAWVIRAVTELAGSDAPFWVRMPGAILHGATALVLGAVAAGIWGRAAAVATAAVWATLPMVAVGSLLFSTDTLMLPCLALSLLCWRRVLAGGGAGWAAAAGATLGFAVLAKYAGIYAALGYALAAAAVPGWRARAADWAVMGAVAAAVVAPNLWWNATNGFATLAHTADNTGWLREGAGLRPGELAVFWASQLAVVGPVVALVALARMVRARRDEAALAVMAALPLAAVSVQALLSGAYANWAAAGWLYAALLAGGALAARPRLAMASFAVNGAVCLALPLLTLYPAAIERGGEPLLRRYLGIADLSRQVLAAAEANGAAAILAERRDVLADLHYTGRDAGLPVFAPRPPGRPRNFYEQTRPLPEPAPAPLLIVAATAPACARDLGAPQVAGGAHARTGLRFWLAEAGCDAASR